jgi:hypothetical protein
MQQSYQTPQHDAIHRYIFNLQNRFNIVKFVAEKRHFEFDKDCSVSLNMEHPIFSPNGTRRFICDCILDVTNAKNCYPTNNELKNGLVTVRSYNNNEFQIAHTAIYKRIIADIKPRIESASNMIGQIKTYMYHLRYNQWRNGVKLRLSDPYMLIVTLDENNVYDDMCADQGIYIYRIKHKDLHILPKESKRITSKS